MNGPRKKFAERAQQAADLNVAVVELLRNSRHAVPTATKILTRITAAAAQHIPAVDHAGITAVEHRGVIRSVAVLSTAPLPHRRLRSGSRSRRTAGCRLRER